MAYDLDREPAAWTAAIAQQKSLFVWLTLALGVGSAVAGVATLLASQTALGLSLIVASLFFLFAARSSMDAAINWLKGANAEAAVGAELNELRGRGYIVMHDLMFGGRGNLDHLVSGPNGVFLVETKFRRYEPAQLGKLKHQAKLVHDELDHWVVPVMCAGKRTQPPYQHNRVWIAGRGQLAGLIEGLPGKPVDAERLARFADRID